jgi:hypothetical protein
VSGIKETLKKYYMLKQWSKEIERISGELAREIRQYMEDSDMVQLKVEGGPLAYFGDEYLHAKIRPGHEIEAEQWLEDTGNSGVIKRTAHWKQLSSVISDLFREGVEIPECFDCEPRQNLSVTKGEMTDVRKLPL